MRCTNSLPKFRPKSPEIISSVAPRNASVANHTYFYNRPINRLGFATVSCDWPAVGNPDMVQDCRSEVTAGLDKWRLTSY